ncbi:hypothetical protein [Pseudarthrobacter sp. NIBRBAC000502770]|uniref:hypothetical protein n=1 Tax=Pseudarthrobacter sp. NIBRBAC000502770 TaxID=2590785 RepID=UPI0011404309|nr:hypothetical protein [Pseudarthrobacter sp. NIBRBAC000502770]QDG88882.1 hypothetical protein NIBR502770_10630 [Pseudarthrobacter sp. NIBRBAC000502770]
MGLFDDQAKFVLDGAEYEHADPRPELAPGSVRRFVYGGEPKVIAQVPLKSGGTAEVHGYATHYNQEWVNVVWTDDVFSHCSCWVPSADIRRPAEGEWRGRFVQLG